MFLHYHLKPRKWGGLCFNGINVPHGTNFLICRDNSNAHIMCWTQVWTMVSRLLGLNRQVGYLQPLWPHVQQSFRKRQFFFALWKKVFCNETGLWCSAEFSYHTLRSALSGLLATTRMIQSHLRHKVTFY